MSSSIAGASDGAAIATDPPASQAMGRIDHISILVHTENIHHYVDRMSHVLGIEFEPPVILEDQNIILCMCWRAGFQFMAPIRPEGRNWAKLEKDGEGAMTVVFGVEDIDAALQRAKENGASVKYEIELSDAIPWRRQFDIFREARLGDMCTLSLAIGQIEPKLDRG